MVRSPHRGNSGSRPTSSMASSLVWGSSSSNVYELPGHRAVGLTPKQWHYLFANTFSEEESLALFEQHHIPASGKIFWGSALAKIHPGKDDT